MFTKNIRFKSLPRKKSEKKIKHKLNMILNEKNEILKSIIFLKIE